MEIFLPKKNLIVTQILCLAALCALFAPLSAHGSCSSPANAIEAENCSAGTPPGTWDIPTKDAGDSSIQGFATDISVAAGSTVFFKVNSSASAWRLDIYRLGYYAGNGARFIATVNPSVSLPQLQPACRSDASTGLVDCGNWGVSASWKVPATATSGIYLAKAIRTDTGGSSHIVFLVRNDGSHSPILFQVSDTTWQAYNNYGGNSFYQGPFCSGYCRAYKLSYNRPFLTRTVEPQTWLFNAEYPMVRWLEANGYDVTYFSATDTDRNGALLLNHKVWISNGHDEYWSGNQRTNVEAARAAGVNLAFLSGNSIYWKTRWENSIDGSSTPYRTLVCYKETWSNAAVDPADPPTWTGTWRDPRFSPPADGGRPENALTGSLTRFADSYLGGPLTVPQADGRMRFWRNTSIASLSPGQTASLVPGTLADELDVDEDNGFRPPGMIHLTTTPITTSTSCLLDFGSTVGSCSTIHNLTLYRFDGGPLVFSTGTYEWAWGLDANHDRSSLGATTSVSMKQATVNLLADMGVQPATLQAGLTQASPSPDQTPPTSTIAFPSSGLSFAVGSTVTITGTATDSGGVVGGVEVSTDGGLSWHPATGRESWSYPWNPTAAGPATILSRAVDDSGNLETPAPGANVTVSGSSVNSLWPASVPAVTDSGPDSAVELGVKFRSDTAGAITGIRFFKGAGNSGTHVGNLWSATGTLLASAVFGGESASGWQQVTFQNPVAITANTVYVASYHTNVGHYSADQFFFSGKGTDAPPLHALADGTSGFDGVYAYGSSSSFPTQGWNATNYWVDVLFSSSSSQPTLSLISVTPANPTVSAGTTLQFTATGTFSDGSKQDLTTTAGWSSTNSAVASINTAGLATTLGQGNSTISANVGGIRGGTTLTVQAVAPLAVSTQALPSGLINASYSATFSASGGSTPYSWSLAAGSLPTGLSLNATTGALSGTPTAAGTFTFTIQVKDSGAPVQIASKGFSISVVPQISIWAANTTPQTVDSGPDSAVELGVRFNSDAAGFITGIRFYKAATNVGTHLGHLWSSTGTLLATATFTGETASGWQQVSFSNPIAITANTIYIASYHTNSGHYSDDPGYFQGRGIDTPPLHALSSGTSGFNGVYTYGTTSKFPQNSWNASNYWVDVLFHP